MKAYEIPALTGRVRARREQVFEDGRILVYVGEADRGGYECGYYFFRPDPRKKQYRKPKLWLTSWGTYLGGMTPEETCRSIRRTASIKDPWRDKAADVLSDLFAWVAQAEEHRFRKPERVVSTTTPGSISMNPRG